MKFIMTAFTNLDLALKLLAAAEDGELTRATIKDGESITWVSGQSHVVLPDQSFDSDDDFVLALAGDSFLAARIIFRILFRLAGSVGRDDFMSSTHRALQTANAAWSPAA